MNSLDRYNSIDDIGEDTGLGNFEVNLLLELNEVLADGPDFLRALSQIENLNSGDNAIRLYLDIWNKFNPIGGRLEKALDLFLYAKPEALGQYYNSCKFQYSDKSLSVGR